VAVTPTATPTVRAGRHCASLPRLGLHRDALVARQIDRAWVQMLTQAQFESRQESEFQNCYHSSVYVELRTHHRLAYDEYGSASATPVVLLHGLSSSRRSYAEVIDHLRPAIESGRIQAFVVDMRGHGESSHATLDSYTASEYAEDIAAFIEALVGRPAVVVGHSLGSVVAASLAATHPSLVRALFLGDPPYFEGDDAVRNASPVAAIFPKVVAAVRELQARNAPASEFEALLPPDTDASERRWRSEVMRGWDPTTMQAAVEGVVWRGFDPLARIDIPHTIVRADPAFGAVFTLADADRVLKANPHAHMVELSGASHMLLAPVSKAAYLAELDAFLSEYLDIAQ
jgi:pimeloyl-ACP methyl ester carboxylesterase